MAKGAALFALAMILIGLTAPLFIKGVLVFSAAMTGMLLVYSLLGKGSTNKEIDRGTTNISNIVIGVALFAVTMVLLSYVAPQFIKGALAFTIGVAPILILYALLGNRKTDKDVDRGTGNIRNMVIGISLFAIVLSLRTGERQNHG